MRLTNTNNVLSSSSKLQEENLNRDRMDRCLLECGDLIYKHLQTLKRMKVDPDLGFLCVEVRRVWPWNTEVAFKELQVVTLS